ncbi:EpsI family protein [Desulfonema ishimotonii]|uniref:EpsI family protein n=2 Tax=Desulfonema ishimotonii TaxID=45657 RepID=A0A401FQG7_9BACT|nr:EpsI family protein [Desulfonema ishimotonii]
MNLKNTLIASALMILGVGLLHYTDRVEEIHPNKSFSTFPREIAQWKGKESRFDAKVYDILGVDDSFLGNYMTPDGQRVQLYIGFYQSQRRGDLIHSPRNCMPGAGWNIVQTTLREIRMSPGKTGQVIRLIIQNGMQKQMMYYWFQSRGRIISSEYLQKIYLVFDSVTRHRTDGSFVRLITPIPGDDEQQAEKKLTDFAEKLMPILSEYIPS